jgi:cytoskeletal protein CcmA (bactofilin family)
MMFIQSNTWRFAIIVLMGAWNAVSADNMLRGNSPEESAITAAATPAVVVESIHQHDARMLAVNIAAPAPAQDVDDLILAKTFDCTNVRNDGTPTTPYELGGETLTAGVYCAPFLTIAAGMNLTLEGNGTGTGDFIFLIDSYITTGAGSNVVLTNSANPTKVFFVVKVGAATLGAQSVIEGSIVAKAAVAIGTEVSVNGDVVAGGAITMTALASVDGDVSAVGAVTLNAEATVSGSVFSNAAVTLGAGADVAGSVFAKGAITLGAISFVRGGGSPAGVFGNSAITLGALSDITGNVYANGAITIGASVELNGGPTPGAFPGGW